MDKIETSVRWLARRVTELMTNEDLTIENLVNTDDGNLYGVLDSLNQLFFLRKGKIKGLTNGKICRAESDNLVAVLNYHTRETKIMWVGYLNQIIGPLTIEKYSEIIGKDLGGKVNENEFKELLKWFRELTNDVEEFKQGKQSKEGEGPLEYANRIIENKFIEITRFSSIVNEMRQAIEDLWKETLWADDKISGLIKSYIGKLLKNFKERVEGLMNIEGENE